MNVPAEFYFVDLKLFPEKVGNYKISITKFPNEWKVMVNDCFVPIYTINSDGKNLQEVSQKLFEKIQDSLCSMYKYKPLIVFMDGPHIFDNINGNKYSYMNLGVYGESNKETLG